MTCSFFIAVPSAWLGAGLLTLRGWEHGTQPGRGHGALGGGGSFWLLLVVANQLQKGEPMSSVFSSLAPPLSCFFPSHFHTHRGGNWEGGKKLEWITDRECGDHCLADIPNTSLSLPMGPGPLSSEAKGCKRSRAPLGNHRRYQVKVLWLPNTQVLVLQASSLQGVKITGMFPLKHTDVSWLARDMVQQEAPWTALTSKQATLMQNHSDYALHPHTS